LTLKPYSKRKEEISKIRRKEGKKIEERKEDSKRIRNSSHHMSIGNTTFKYEIKMEVTMEHCKKVVEMHRDMEVVVEVYL